MMKQSIIGLGLLSLMFVSAYGSNVLYAPKSIDCMIVSPGYLQCQGFDRNYFFLSVGPYSPITGTYHFLRAQTLRGDQFPIYIYAIGDIQVTLFTRGSQQPVADIHSGGWAHQGDGTYLCTPPVQHCGFSIRN